MQKINKSDTISYPIGKIFRITIDRPLGSCHPKYNDIIYPLNYGYIEGIIAPDGEEQDVYLLGVNEAVSEFEGQIIAVIHRKNDIENKWVAAPLGTSFTKDEIASAVRFQEQYFDSEIII